MKNAEYKKYYSHGIAIAANNNGIKFIRAYIAMTADIGKSKQKVTVKGALAKKWKEQQNEK